MTWKTTKKLILCSIITVVVFSVMFQTNMIDSKNLQEEEYPDFDLMVNELGLKPDEEFGMFSTRSSVHNYTKIGSFTDAGEAHNVVVWENFAFLADGSNGLRVLNITDKTNPTEYGSYKNGSAICYDVKKLDHYLFLAYGLNGFVVLDIDMSLFAPPPIASIHSNKFGGYECNSLDIDIDGNWTYVTCGGYGLVAIDIRDPSDPIYQSRFYSAGIDFVDCDAFTTIEKPYVYIADYNYGITRITYSDYENRLGPTLYGSGHDSGSSSSIYIYDDFTGFVADYSGFISLALQSFPYMNAYDIYSDGNHANGVYMTNRTAFVTYANDKGMKMFNVTDRADIKYVGLYNDTGDALNVLVYGDYAYLSDGTDGLEIILLDTDSDGIYDGYEIYETLTDETDPDTDDDNILDGDEFYGYYAPDNPYADDSGDHFWYLDPLNNDTDSDLINDYEEAVIGLDSYYTDPENNDSDTDRLDDFEEIYTHLTDPTNPDTDGDTISDGAEILDYGTDPLLGDSDYDLMPDNYEIFYGLNPLFDDADLDFDTDQLSNFVEYNDTFTNPSDNDTDNDLLLDGWEVLGYYNDSHTHSNDTYYIVTNAPLIPDADSDGLLDGEEVLYYDTNPLDPDSDDDLVSDYDERITFLTDPNDSDTDDDLLDDWWETHYGTNPLIDDASADPDNDDLTNMEEYNLGTHPNLKDTDGDGIDDKWEVDHSLNPTSPADGLLDPDLDGLSNYEEFLINTDPHDSDTDQDGMDDLWESENGTNPLVDDADDDPDEDGLTNINEMLYNIDPLDDDYDNDGLLDGFEIELGTNPRIPDTDGDGYSDYEEYQKGTDPLDANSNPFQKNKFIYISIGSAVAVGIIILLVVFFVFYWTTRPEQKLFRYIAKQKSAGIESITLKDLTEHLEKRLNKGDIKQLINEFSDAKKMTLSGNRVFLTNVDEISKNIDNYSNWISQSKSRVITSKEKKEIMAKMNRDLSMCDKLGFVEEANEIIKLLEEIR
ncbi:MAG: hypothetical protein FK730_05040 [Asgard group archaeon]|nr:hypothetical protein [Asgard group archaeon]